MGSWKTNTQTMSPKELNAGKRWIEQRFTEIADELNLRVTLAAPARWSEPSTTRLKHAHCMAYEVVHGRHRRGEMMFRDVDLEDVGCGEKAPQDRLAQEIRRLLESFQTV